MKKKKKEKKRKETAMREKEKRNGWFFFSKKNLGGPLQKRDSWMKVMYQTIPILCYKKSRRKPRWHLIPMSPPFPSSFFFSLVSLSYLPFFLSLFSSSSLPLSKGIEEEKTMGLSALIDEVCFNLVVFFGLQALLLFLFSFIDCFLLSTEK